MIKKFENIILNRPNQMVLGLALFTFISNYLNYAYFGQENLLAISLAAATALITVIVYYIYAWVLKRSIFGIKSCYILLLLVPLIYLTTLTVIFGLYGSISNFHQVNASIRIQIYLLVWSFLGNGFFYTIFAPKIALFLTNLYLMALFFVQVRVDKQQ